MLCTVEGAMAASRTAEIPSAGSVTGSDESGGVGENNPTWVFTLGASNSKAWGMSMFLRQLCIAETGFQLRWWCSLVLPNIIDDMQPKTTDCALACFCCGCGGAQRRELRPLWDRLSNN